MRSVRHGGPKSINASEHGDPASVAINVLAFLAERPELLQRFFALTGYRPETLREAARSPGLFAALLDFLLGHEPTLLSFAEASGRDPAAVSAARHALQRAPRGDTE